jgi:hypothetical protein
MICKECQKPVFQAIEGELICESCWSWGQMSTEERERNEEIDYMLTHCNENDCEALLCTKKERETLFCKKHYAQFDNEDLGDLNKHPF